MADAFAEIQRKMRKTYLKVLKKYTEGKINKAKKLESKIIQLELELKKLG